MIKLTARDVMLNVKLLSNPKRMYRVKQIVNLETPRDMNMTIEGCQRPIVNNAAVEAKNLTTNIAIILQTLKNKCVINVNPAEQDISLVNDQLGQVLANLREKMKYSYDRVVGLVVGGRAYDCSNPFADQGRELTNEIRRFLKEEHIPSTQLIEQKLGNDKGINVYSHRENAVLTGNIFDNFDRSSINSSEQFKKAGEDLFEIFEVSKEAPISFVDEILPSPSANIKYRQAFTLE